MADTTYTKTKIDSTSINIKVSIDAVVAPSNATRSVFDIAKAIQHLDSQAGKESKGTCARYVRLAIKAGGIDINPNPVSAKDYGPYLIKYGFKEIAVTSYNPEIDAIKGDIAVIQGYDEKTINGHITMYNGNKWVSDFKQKDMWSGDGYRKKKPAYSVYRWEM